MSEKVKALDGVDGHPCVRVEAYEAMRRELEEARAALRKVKSVYDMQMPSLDDGDFMPGARMAHQWWATVLGGVLNDPHVSRHLERP